MTALINLIMMTCSDTLCSGKHSCPPGSRGAGGGRRIRELTLLMETQTKDRDQ